MGQSGGSGGGFLSDLLDVGINFGTMGAVGYKDGKLRKGALLKGGDEVLGEITGRNLQREAQNKAEARAIEEEAKRNKMLQDERFRRQQEDIQASGAALAVQNRGSARAFGRRGGSVYSGSSLGGEESLLGL